MIDRLRLRTTGTAAVEDVWQRFVPSARLHGVVPHRFAFAWDSATVDGLAVIEYELNAAVHSRVAPDEQLMVCRLVADDGGAWDTHGPLVSRLPWATTERPVEARWDGRARVQAFVFDRAEAQRQARRMTGDDAFVLGIADARPDPAVGGAWQRAFRYAAQTLRDPASDPAPLLHTEVARHALHVTLSAFSPAFATAVDGATQRSAAPATVRRALAFIDAHAHEPITVDDIARAAGITPRGLQYAFRRALGTSPRDRLRQVRLSGAHADLCDPHAGSVGEIAARWGFGHGARFAALYRAAYGVNPAQTRRAHR
ncbi:helix-turn-helix transcriptional regulator [Microbacterium telephonicum]|uniref:AraC-like DNA-binding protein n=1 Tax=Microbacterium telephonicum TaxID=1714841 RepID=A0A498C9R2_9MICO|nr:helix-turn-helix transcriptional regulator [Microbacterium telephonicum]RLK49051.1 AraC-like DNA-binding protein [Microbacterium telephonicum]